MGLRAKTREIISEIKDKVVGKVQDVWSRLVPITISSVIYIDDLTKTVSIYYREEEGKGEPVIVTESFRHNLTDETFASALSRRVKLHFEKKAFGKTILVLPDKYFFTDTIKLPVIQKKAMSSSLGFAFNTVYSNYNELKYLSYPLFRDKKNAIYNVIGIRRELLDRAISALVSIGLDVAGVTFASNASICMASTFNAKIRTADCVLVDVKERATRLTLVVDGKAASYYNLPFGYSRFSSKDVYREDTLFDHAATELLVLNANEKAKHKKLTTYATDEVMEDFIQSASVEGGDENLSEENANGDSYLAGEVEEPIEEMVAPQVVGGKAPKRLPKYMLRPTPETEEGILYENFRHLVKWAMEVAKSNNEIFVTGAPKTVYVNMPEKYNSVFETIKTEEYEEGVAFLPLTTSEEENAQKTKLELYGGLNVIKRGRVNVF